MKLKQKLFAELEEIKRIASRGNFNESEDLPAVQALGVRVEAIKTQLEIISMSDDLELLDEEQGSI